MTVGERTEGCSALVRRAVSESDSTNRGCPGLESEEGCLDGRIAPVASFVTETELGISADDLSVAFWSRGSSLSNLVNSTLVTDLSRFCPSFNCFAFVSLA